ncbi:MAG: DEAD/DEAH box helicase, partial [Candidatus Hydrothermarchaeaceae archaeon]
AIDGFGFTDLTYIQEKAILPAMSGRDLIGQGPTGSGKTLAFGIPIAERLDAGKGIQALIVCPTRELTLQDAGVLKDTCRYRGIKVATIYGGTPIEPQIKSLKSCEVVVGTPGRLLDHLRRGTLKLNGIRILVLDEADRMVDMGFIDDIRKIIRATPEKRQTMLFSATITKPVHNISQRFMRNTMIIKPESGIDAPEIEQSYIEVKDSEKFQLLLALIVKENPEMGIIFTNMKVRADLIANNLLANNQNALALHGDLTQFKRETVMEEFRAGNLRFLVATDVASRGLDIPAVSHIFNYDVPDDPDDYVHRIGRTARAGRKGRAICLLSPSDHDNMRNLHQIHPDLAAEKIEFDLSKYSPLDTSLRSKFMRRTKVPRRRGGPRRGPPRMGPRPGGPRRGGPVRGPPRKRFDSGRGR